MQKRFILDMEGPLAFLLPLDWFFHVSRFVTQEFKASLTRRAGIVLREPKIF